ncbi:MAG: lipid-binding SYLF domain-containing protein [Halioglobus sp.]|nr:lipid-binding SYLF domain-containing protein [Halioglobus sp.]
MRRLLKFVVLLSLCVGGSATWANSYSDTIKAFSGAGESGKYFKMSYGYAVFPTVGKGGLFYIGGGYGEGKVFVNAKHVGNSTMTQLSLGPQIGAQAFSQIIFFQNEQAFNDFTSGNFEFSAQASAVVITAGISAEANTGGGTSAGMSGGRNDAVTASGGYRKGMAIFTIATGGLMFEAALGGQKFSYTQL